MLLAVKRAQGKAVTPAFVVSQESATSSKLFSRHSWSERGWCAVERFCRELSEDSSYIFIKTPTVSGTIL